jgi:hypothetical protein
VKCDKCGYMSFDYNLTCPACNKDLGVTRSKLGVNFVPPEMDFDELFTGGSGLYKTAAAANKESEAELDLESVGDEFEFTLDD